MNTLAILGPAGSGKSTEIRNRAGDDPNYAKVAATTGVAAVNLGPGVTTINSVLGFFNEESARDALEAGALSRRFVALARQGFANLVIDEVSMMSAALLSTVVKAAQEAEEIAEGQGIKPVGLILTGDFLQLSPVRGRYAFNAPEWETHFEENVQRLDKVYRQSNPQFLEALTHARAGRGTSATQLLKQAGVEFVNERNDYFDGASLVPTNAIAEKINATRFEDIDALARRFDSKRWGMPQSEWKEIPETLWMKETAWVTILSNEPQTFEHVNGDQGKVREMGIDLLGEPYISVEIHRSTKIPAAQPCEQHPACFVHVKQIHTVRRETVQRVKPEGVEEFSGFLIDGVMLRSMRDIKALYAAELEELANRRSDEELDLYKPDLERKRARRFAQFFERYDAYVKDAIKRLVPYYSSDKDNWVVGWIEYMPIRLGWASTIHKAQGLTLDRIQIDARSSWRNKDTGEMCGAGAPGMMYVALSRCRTPENIRVVCGLADFTKRIQTAKECLRWV